MGELAERLSLLSVEAVSPDGGVSATAQGPGDVRIGFAPGAYQHYRTAALARQLESLATALWARYRRRYLEIVSSWTDRGVEGLQSLATTLSNTGPLQNKKVDIGGMTVPPIITGMQSAMTELTKSIDAQQQELANGLSSFTEDVHANWNRILVRSPREMNDARNADGPSLKASDSFRVR